MSDGSYITPGRSKVFWVVTISSTAAPTEAELQAGVDLTPKLRGLPSFNYPSNTADISDLSSFRDKGIPGTVGIGTVNFELKRATTTETEYDSIDERDEGNLCVFRKGLSTTQPTTADTVDVYAGRINSMNPGNPGRNDPDFEVVEFVGSDDPQRDKSVTT